MIKINAKVEGGWQTLNNNELTSNSNQGSTEISDYIYQEHNGMIIECMTANLSADGSSIYLRQEVPLKRPFTNAMISCCVDCDATNFYNCNLSVSAVPAAKDKVRVSIRHINTDVKLKGSFTLYLTCFGY